MKVAHVITALSLGGAEQVAEDLSITFRSKGIETHIIALVTPDPNLGAFSHAMRERLADAGVRVHDLAARDKRLGLLRRLPALAALLARERFDLVHAHVDHAEFAVSLVSRVGRFRRARTIHNTVLWPGHGHLARITERGWRDDLVIAVSDPAMSAHVALRQSLGLPVSAWCRVILNGVPFIEGGSAVRNTGPLRIGFFGRSTPQKGLDVLLEALRTIPAGSAPFELTVHSDAATDPAVQARVSALAHVTLQAPVIDARQRLGRFDLIVMPSRFEGMPLVAIEALATGTPLLATNAPGLREVLPPDWPLVVPPGDVAALRNALLAAADDPAFIRGLRARAAAHGRCFAIQRTAERYLIAYDAYLSRAALPATS